MSKVLDGHRTTGISQVGAAEFFWDGLSPQLRTRMTALGRIVDLPADHLLWEEDQRPGFVAVLLSGFLRMLRYSADGRRQIMVIVPPGELVGEGVETRAGYRLEAATPVRLLRLERAAFERLMEEVPDIGRSIYRQCVGRLDRLQRMTWALGLQSPEERLCAFLADACQVMPFEPGGAGGILTMELPRADIADYLGTTRETISRLTHKLKAAGLIVILDPRRFEIPDIDRLARAGACLSGRAAPALVAPRIAQGAQGVQQTA